MATHSVLGASSAYRWLNCPGSVALCQKAPKSTSSYATKGTAAHSLAEMCLLNNRDAVEYLDTTITADSQEIMVDADMAQAVQVYVDKINEDRAFGGELEVEKKFHLDWLHPSLFGTNDACLIIGKTLIIYDYKNGARAVSAEGNSQMKYYALGKLGKGNPLGIEKVITIIVQPNCYGKRAIDMWTYSVDYLYFWAYEVLLVGANRALEPDAPCRSGDWCTFCGGKALCSVKRKEYLDLLDTPDGVTLPDPSGISNAKLGEIIKLFNSDDFKSWVKALNELEYSKLSSGEAIPNRCIIDIETKANRSWISEQDVIATLKEYGEDIFNSSIKSPAQIEKLLTSLGVNKKERVEIVEPLTERVTKNSTIVVDTDDPRVEQSKQNIMNML